MTRAERRNEKKKYGKDFASFRQILNRYFPDFSGWLASLKDPRKFWTYEMEVMLKSPSRDCHRLPDKKHPVSNTEV